MLNAGLEQESLEVYEHSDPNGQIFHIHIEREPIYRDDLTGQLLEPALVHAARAKELEYFESKKVWIKRPVEEARRLTGKPPISVRWVHV